MKSVASSEFQNRANDYLGAASQEPVVIVSHDGVREAVLVSPEFFDRALAMLEDQHDIRAAAEARRDTGPDVAHNALVAELDS